MRLYEIDLPHAVINAQKRGELAVFAGAGVSIDAPSNYPNFRDLAKEIGGTTYPIYDHELIDRYLGRLVGCGLAVHDRVRLRLSDPLSRPNHLHESIIKLFGSASATRIVTTNFDDHFRVAALSVFGDAPEIYRAPALPLGDDFKGIVHLHGSVLDDSKRLLLTDADFGRAYLTQGWARRFVQRLFAKFVVLFVGYSHQDLPLLYLARGISAAEAGPGRFALTSPDADTDWLNLGITPVPYPLRAPPLYSHGALGDCLAEWAKIANLGAIGTEARIKGIVMSDRPLSIEDEAFLKHSLLDVSTLRYFTRHAKDPRWLEWISDLPEFSPIFVPGAKLSETSAELATWFAEHFAISHFAVSIDLVRRKHQTLSPNLWMNLAIAFHRRAAAGEPLRFWAPILAATMPANARPDFLAYMIGHCTVPDDKHTILQLFRKLGAVTLKLKRNFFALEDDKHSLPDGKVVPVGDDYWMSEAYQKKISPHLNVFARGLALIITAAFEEARALLFMYGDAGPKLDPISFSRGSVSSRTQDFLHNGFSVLIDAGADVLKWSSEHDPKFASILIGQWIASDAPILRRLAIAGMTQHRLITSDEQLYWAISNGLVEDAGLKNETFALLREVFGASNERVRAELLAHAETAINPEGKEGESYGYFNLLSWLHLHAPECTLVTEKLRPIRERHPEWKVHEHPDFNFWMSGGAVQAVSDRPVPASQIAEMNLEALLAESARLAAEKNMFGDSLEGGFLQEIASTAAGNFVWSERIAQEGLARADVSVEIWSALMRGWSTNHAPAEWSSLLAILEHLEPIYSSVLYELGVLLKGAVGRREDGFPIELLEAALARANAGWAACSAHEMPLPEEAKNWVTVAINRRSGDLMDFYFDALRVLWPNRNQEEVRIRVILQALETAIDGDNPASEVARVLVSARAALLAEISPDWYREHVLPLLATTTSPRSAEQNWDGYLIWGSWTQAVLPGLLPAYMKHLPGIVEASNDRSEMFCNHLAGVAVFGGVDPIDCGWLDEFLTRSARRERIQWIGNVTEILGGADEQAKESAWNRWLKRYLRRRVQATPIPLDSQESGAICEWALTLESYYEEIIELLLEGPAPSVKGQMLYYRLYKSGLLDRNPPLTARLLTALLSREDGYDFWYLDQVHAMVSQLIDLDPTEPELRRLCEQLGRLGSTRALEFQGRLG